MRTLLGIHAALLLLASTAFTIVTVLIGGKPLTWCYAHYSSSYGFGSEYTSNFTLPEIATYLIAFLTGILAFATAYRGGRRFIGALGVALSILGVISFTLERSHWIFNHHRSWLAFSPALMFCLIVAGCLPNRKNTAISTA